MVLVLELLSGALLLAEVWGCFHVARWLIQRQSPKWWLAEGVALAVGVVLGLAAYRPFTYSLGNNLEAAGLPFPVVLFQYEHGRWVDYPSRKAFWILDIVLLAALPQLVLAVATIRRREVALGA